MFLSGHRRTTRAPRGAAGTRSKERAACDRDRAPNEPIQLIGCQITPLIIPGHPIVNNPNDNKSNIRGQCARCLELTKVDKREFSSKKTLFTDAWLKRRISIGKISGIALLMEIDLEPLHLPDVLEVVLHPQDPERSVETYRGTSSLQCAPSSPTGCRSCGSG